MKATRLKTKINALAGASILAMTSATQAVVIDFTGRRDGEEFPGGQGKDFPMLLGGGQMLADFENAVRGLSAEVEQKLERVRPQTIGQAQRIPGMTPAAISLLLVHLERQRRERAA